MKHTLIVLALASCTALGACGTKNLGMESVHQPVVSRTDYVYDMAAPNDRLDGLQASGLTGWFDSLNLRYGDHVSVDTQGYGAGARDAVASVVARYGLIIDEAAPITQGDVPAGSIRVIVSRMTAGVPGCPDFSRPASPNLSGDSASNYGCATNTNLAMMVADPQDLITGRAAPNTADAAMGAKAISTYRKATTTGSGGLKSESTKGN